MKKGNYKILAFLLFCVLIIIITFLFLFDSKEDEKETEQIKTFTSSDSTYSIELPFNYVKIRRELVKGSILNIKSRDNTTFLALVPYPKKDYKNDFVFFNDYINKNNESLYGKSIANTHTIDKMASNTYLYRYNTNDDSYLIKSYLFEDNNDYMEALLWTVLLENNDLDKIVEGLKYNG